MDDNRKDRNGYAHTLHDLHDFAAADWTGTALPHITQVVSHSFERTSTDIDKKRADLSITFQNMFDRKGRHYQSHVLQVTLRYPLSHMINPYANTN